MAYASWSVVFGEQPTATKWNILGTNDASFNDGTGIADDKIEPVHLATGLSSSTWAWVSWTPTWANFAIGNGTNACKYMQVGKTVFYRIITTLGTTSSMGSAPTFTLPVTSITVPDTDTSIGWGFYPTTSASGRSGMVRWASTTTGALMTLDINADVGSVNATNPYGGGWLNGYQICVSGFYEAA